MAASHLRRVLAIPLARLAVLVVSVPQFPPRHSHVVQSVTESAVVEIDDPDLIAPEQRVAEVQAGVDEADIGSVFAQVAHDAPHAGGHPGPSIHRSTEHTRGSGTSGGIDPCSQLPVGCAERHGDEQIRFRQARRLQRIHQTQNPAKASARTTKIAVS